MNAQLHPQLLDLASTLIALREAVRRNDTQAMNRLDDVIASFYPDGSDDAELLNQLQHLRRWSLCRKLTRGAALKARDAMHDGRENGEGKRVRNLLAETRYVLASNGCAPSQVCFAQVGEREGDWDAFEGLARDLWYNPGFGTAEVDMRLKIVGPGWWLDRVEYDGSERWEFHVVPRRAESAAPLGCLWDEVFLSVQALDMAEESDEPLTWLS